MNVLTEKLVNSMDDMINEMGIKNTLKTAGLVTALGAAALGIGNLVSTSPEKSVKKQITAVIPADINKDTEKSVDVETSIDIDRIISIESSNDASAVNKRTGARGLMQIMKPTWIEMIKKMKVDYSWDDAFDGEKNKAVGSYYMNTEIPRLLKHYNIEDTTENRLAAYNWGIGYLNRQGIEEAPQETVDYIKKYKKG